MPGHLDWPGPAVVHDDDPLGGADAGGADPTCSPRSVWGTEYWPCSNAIIGVFGGTRRASPNTTVWGSSGTRCSRVCSSLSISAGDRRVTRCWRPFTSVMNSSQACSSSAKQP